MALFGRKQEAPAPAPDPKLEKKAEVKATPEVKAKPKADTSAKAKPKPKSEFGIQKAIELMRNLPADNIPLVVAVVRTTLESTNIDVPTIIDDAKTKRARIASRIEGLRGEITDFEAEITARKQEIAVLEADGAETKMVQERFELAMKKDEQSSESAAASKSKSTSKSKPVQPPATSGTISPAVTPPNFA